MGYFDENCQSDFTPGQVQRMVAIFEATRWNGQRPTPAPVPVGNTNDDDVNRPPPTTAGGNQCGLFCAIAGSKK